MKQSDFGFVEGFLTTRGINAAKAGKKQKAFNWDKAAEIIKENYSRHPDLVAEAGLQGDWEYTGGVIFENGKPTNDSYTFLQSNWATPTLILSWDGSEQEEINLGVEDSRWDSGSKWDDQSLSILGIKLKDEY